jgi:hypothetical protein
MRSVGFLLGVAGVLVLVVGFAFDPSVPTGAGRVVNIQLSGTQLQIVITGLAMVLGGLVLYSGGAIVAAVERLAETVGQVGQGRPEAAVRAEGPQLSVPPAPPAQPEPSSVALRPLLSPAAAAYPIGTQVRLGDGTVGPVTAIEGNTLVVQAPDGTHRRIHHSRVEQGG